MNSHLVIALWSGLIGAILSALITWTLNRRESRLAAKREVLWRLLGYRLRLVNQVLGDNNGTNSHVSEPFVALNEIFVGFADSPDVIRKVVRIQREARTTDNFYDNCLDLIKSMARICKILIGSLNDEFILKPLRSNKK